MSNFNANSINVKTLNFTGNHMYHRGTPIKLLDEDISGNLCLFNDLYPNNPLEIGINICPGTTVISNLPNPQPPGTIEAKQIMSAALDVSGAIQLAFGNDLSADPANNLGKIAFFPDPSNNYRFWGCEESRNPDGTVSHDTWRLLTSSFANQAYWTQNGTDLYYNGGNVGIGLINPTEKLDVNGNVLIRGYLDMSCNAIKDVSGIYFCDHSSITAGNSLDISGDGISFMTKGDGTEQMTINSSGLVGIGETSPTANVDIQGHRIGTSTTRVAIKMRYLNTASYPQANTGPFYMEMGLDDGYPWDGGNFYRLASNGDVKGTNKYAPLIFQVSSKDVMTLDTSGNVGIGTTDPSARLDISGGDVQIMHPGTVETMRGVLFKNENYDRTFYIVGETFGSGYGSKHLYFGYTEDSPITSSSPPNSFTNGSILTIRDGGHVGIGTSSAAIKDVTLNVARLDNASDISNNLLRLSAYTTSLDKGPAMEFYVKQGIHDRVTAAIEGELIEVNGGNGSGNLVFSTTNNLIASEEIMRLGPSAGSGNTTARVVIKKKVGIGVNIPFTPGHAGTDTLTVSGSSQFDGIYNIGALYDTTELPGTAGQVLTSTITGTEWADQPGQHWSATGNDIYANNSGNVGIGTNGPTAKLEVAGGDALIHGVQVGRGAGNISSNTVVGYGALSTSGAGKIQNVAVGYAALLQNATGQNNVALGYLALQISDTNKNTAVGSQALSTNTGNHNTATGYQALSSNKGDHNTATGHQALAVNAGSYNTATGYGAMTEPSGNYNVATGYQALSANKFGGFNTAIGASALSTSTDGSYNVATGYAALSLTSGSNNTATGYRALQANTDGSYNVATGCDALMSNTTGQENVAVGYNALQTNTTGDTNVAIGSNALKLNETGMSNVATGYYALWSNTDGSYNVATGYSSLINNTTGLGNIATGSNALYNNSTGGNNVATGTQALYSNTDGNYNVATGTQALYSNTDGNYNVATGPTALWSNTIGGSNVATGYAALYSNIDGSSNVAIGYNTLYYNTSSDNVAIGALALQANTTGVNNVATGYNALLSNQTGNNNVATGYTALRYSNGSNNVAIGTSALYGNSAGGNNVAVGMQALEDNDASYNVALGYEAGKGQTDISNTINVGYDASCNASNIACIGNADISCVYFGSINGNAKLDCSGIKTTDDIDMSCNRIIDVSGIYFCDASGSSITGGNSLDISSNTVYFKNKGGIIPVTVDISGDISCDRVVAGPQTYTMDVSTSILEINANFTENNFSQGILHNPNALHIISRVNSNGQNWGSGVECINFSPYTDSEALNGYQRNVKASIITGISQYQNLWSRKGYLAFATTSQTAYPGPPATEAEDTRLIEKMRIRSDGRVGIGTQVPTAMLDISATMIAASGGALPTALNVRGTAFISDDVGIGTTTPSVKLEVNGDISCNDTLTLSSLKIDGEKIFSTSSTTGINIILDPSNGKTNLIGNVTVLAPTDDSNPATKLYVDQTANGLKVQEHVALATTSANTNITLSGFLTIDGTTVVSGQRVLVKNQDSTKEDNGVYITNSGAWGRASDFSVGTNISGYYVFVEGGTDNLHTGWVVTGTNIVVGIDDIIFSKFSSTGNINAGRGLQKNGETLNVSACPVTNDDYVFQGDVVIPVGKLTYAGTTVTATGAELNYCDGVTSPIQTQLTNKQALAADLTSLSSCQTGGAAALAALTSTEIAILDGATVTTAELNYCDGVTSPIQTQLNSNDTDIANNSNAIASNDTDIANNSNAIASNDTDIANNSNAIASNDTDIAANTSNINTNTSNISSNTNNISSNDTAITNIKAKTDFISVSQAVNLDTMESGIATNVTNISSNDSDIAAIEAKTDYISVTQAVNLDTMESGIATNVTNINSNDSDIAAIEAKTDYISVTQAVNLDTMESGIATNTSNISTNTGNISTIETKTDFISVSQAVNLDTMESGISTNTSNISTNTGNISTIETKTDFISVSQAVNLDTMESGISTNTSNISTNTSNISSNTNNISSNDTDIAANTSNISTNTSNISSNTNNISSNDTDIAYNSNICTSVSDLTFNMERSGSHTGFGVTPLYPVHIGGGTDGGSSGYFLDFDGGTGGVYGTTLRYDDRPVGLYVAAYTWSNYGYMHSSDRRTKENIREVPGGLALKQIRQIPCVYYDYIDKFKRGSQSTIGFIAQDVKEVLPMSVSLQKDIIPNEMRIIENPVWNELTDFSGNKTYKLTINDLEDVSGNIRYKFYVRNNGGAVEKEIVSLKNEPNAFIFDELWTDVFLFGKEVDDFHTIDKSKIFALNFSATQEIDRIQQSLTQRISNLEQEEKTKLAFAKAKISVLESENKELKARLTSIEARLDAAGI